MPAPARRDIEFTQGDSYVHTVTLLDDGDPAPLDGGATVAAQVRSYAGAPVLLATFTVSVDSNVITLELSGTETGGIPTGKHRWDLEIQSGDSVATILSGDCTVLGQVTVP